MRSMLGFSTTFLFSLTNGIIIWFYVSATVNEKDVLPTESVKEAAPVPRSEANPEETGKIFRIL